MRCPRLDELPLPPAGKTGWPWNEETPPLAEHMPDGAQWPKISVVTPSYNQAQFIEETIRSVLLQGYPDLEFIIIDGGSRDDTVQVIKKYEPWISYWISEPDRGQSHALNKGFRRATGALVGWQNSDDYYGARAFESGAFSAQAHPEVELFCGPCQFIDSHNAVYETTPAEPFSWDRAISQFPNFAVPNQSTLFRRSIFDRGEFINESYCHAMDAEFTSRLLLSGAKIQSVSGLTGVYRFHDACKTAYQPAVCAAEVCRLCVESFEQHRVPPELYQGALVAFRRWLVMAFRAGAFRDFRLATRKLWVYGGTKALDAKLIARYLFSLLGRRIALPILHAVQAVRTRRYVSTNRH